VVSPVRVPAHRRDDSCRRHTELCAENDPVLPHRARFAQRRVTRAAPPRRISPRSSRRQAQHHACGQRWSPGRRRSLLARFFLRPAHHQV